MNKLKPEIKAVWLASLRGSEYTQGYEKLRDENTFCCLGVLCDIYRKETPGTRWNEEGYFITGGGDEGLFTLPQDVVRWAFSEIDFSAENPVILSEKLDLSRLNDGEGSRDRPNRLPKTFNEIADMIEENL